MFVSLFFIALSLLGVGFLIFIHELGHYWMARRVGMRVETFSIGFGQPIVSWEYQGAKWQIGWIPFGGFVKIAGSELDGDKDPYAIKDGLFGAKPIDRIKVAFAGPLANLLLALLAFTMLWTLGGRSKSFSEYTKKIGWIDTESELYLLGVRPGDEIATYDGHPYESSKDHLYSAMISDGPLQVQGYKVDYASGKKTPFDYLVSPYPHPESLDKGILTVGITTPASYLIYNRLPDGSENPLPEGAPIKDSGLQYGDRLLWIDGELVFSLPELNYLVSGSHALLTIQRGSKTLLVRVPRVQVQELRPDPQFREELTDWQFAAKLQSSKIQDLSFIPYNLTNDAVVEAPLKFVDKEKEEQVHPTNPYSQLEQPLEAGDKIIAIDGMPIQRASDLLEKLQTYQVLIIVDRQGQGLQKGSWETADEEFDKEIDMNALKTIISSIGTDHLVTSAGRYQLLKPVTPKSASDFALVQSPDKIEALQIQKLEQRKAINAIENAEQRNHALKVLEKHEKRLLLGVSSQDRKIDYNPSPLISFKNVVKEIWRTLVALFSGNLNPKWMVGPVGIVHMVHNTSMGSITEALYWLGVISLNLGILNLLPVPVLDGGTILMSFVEMITKQRIHPKTMEKLIIPFAFVLIGFFIYLTYNDLLRLFGDLLR